MGIIGEKIRVRRLTKNYSQEYMAFMLEISQAAYSKLERDETNISLRRIYEIAEILEMSPFELMPKPKYGTGINQEFIRRTLNKLGKFWSNGLKKRMIAVPVSITIGHS
ncbi:MAG TPA: helix-turn-helix transcriptional regulator, partial [Mucilaginibacter sp.]